MSNRNANTRAIVSALQSDFKSLRAAAASLVDKATKGSSSPRPALMAAFECEQRTADKILRFREGVSKSGAVRE